jgi:outer membrane lipoprotein-sorting protein
VNETYLYGGTLDRTGVLMPYGGPSVLVDLKTGQKADWHAIQTAAYAELLNRAIHKPVKRFSLYLQEDGSIARIKEHEATLKTFTAAFQQTKKTALLKKPLESQGLVYFDAKGKLLLSVTSPSRVKILFENGRMTVYDPDTLEAQERYLGSESMIKKYFGIGASMEELEKQYALELLPRTHARDYHLRLTPKVKAMAEHIQTIDVRVSSNQWLPQRIEVRETDGDVTAIMLDFTSINVPLPQDAFEIEVRENH